jgi:hypothetical protein
MYSFLRYRHWPEPEELIEDFQCSMDEAALMLLQLKVLLPTDEFSRLLYLNEYYHMCVNGAYPVMVMSRLHMISRDRQDVEGVIWTRHGKESKDGTVR